VATRRHPNNGPKTEAAARTTLIRALDVLRDVSAKLAGLVLRDAATSKRKNPNAQVFYLWALLNNGRHGNS
jgi:hypothetical protein